MIVSVLRDSSQRWLAFLVLACQISPVSAATTLSPDSTWTQFRWFGDSGSLESLDGPYTFTVPTGQLGVFDITDAFEIGDRFTLTDGDTILGVTPSASGSGFTRDPDVAFASSTWSSATYELQAGSHRIELETTTLTNGQTLGGAFIRLRFEDLEQLTWDTPASITYGTPLSSAQLDAAVLDGRSGTFTYAPPAGTVLPAGDGQELTVSFTPTDLADPPLTATVAIQVRRAPLALEIESITRTFGEANPSFTASYTGFVNNDTEADLSATPTLSTAATSSSPPGTYPITASGTFDPNYDITVANGTLTIVNDSSIEITWPPPASIVYGTPLTPTELSASVTNGIPGTFTYTPAIGTVLNAGNHTLNLTFTPEDQAFAPIGASQMLSVKRTPLTIRADDKVATQTELAKPLSFVLVDNPGNTAHSSGHGAVSSSFEIGEFEVTNSLYTNFLNAVGKNDPITNGQFSMHPPLYNPEMERTARGGIRRFGSAPNFSYQVKPGMGDKPINFTSFWDACRFCNWLHNGRPDGDQIATTTEDGAYDLTDAEAVANNTVSRKPGARFFLPSENQWFKAAFHAPNAPGGYRLYATGSNTQPAAALADSQGNVTNSGPNVANYGRNADWDANQNGTIETEVVNGILGEEDGNVTSVGSTGSVSFYGVADMGGNVSEWTDTALANWARIDRGGSWNGSEAFLVSAYRVPSPFSEEVQDRGFRVARPAGPYVEWVIPNLSVSYFGLVNGDTPGTIGSAPSITTTATPVSNDGEYPITVSGAFATNYLITYQSGNLLLNNKANPSISWFSPADITYGNAISSTQLNASSGGVPGIFTYEPTLDAMLDVGTHTLITTFLPTDTSNFNPVTTKVSLMVTPAPLTIQADNITLTSPDVDLTASYEGLVNGDTPSDLYVPVSLGTNFTPTSEPGTYPITASGASSPNYSIIYIDGTLTRAERTQPPLTWGIPAPITYGTAIGESQLNATTDEIIGGSFTYTPPLGTVLEPTQSATLDVIFTPDDTFNFKTVSTSVSLVVNKAPLTLTITDAQRAAGVANPTFSASYSGFVLEDTEANLENAFMFETTATIESAPGTYPITGSIATDPNYDITIIPGTLTIAPKGVPSSNWPTPTPLTYGQALSDTQLNAVIAEEIPGQWSYQPAIGTILEVGSHTLSATFTPDNLFAFEGTSATVSLTILPAPLTIRARDVERPFGDENPVLGFDYVGFVNGDSSTAIDQRPTISTTATKESTPGTYPIVLANATDANYTITLSNGTLTVLEPDVLPLPQLFLARLGNEISLSWNHHEDVGLEQSETLIEWMLVDQEIPITDGIANWVFTLPDEAATKPLFLYRLVRVTKESDR